MKFANPDCTKCISRGHSLLNHCTEQELINISSSKGCSIYKKGQYIFHEGSKPFGLFCVNSGKVKITKESSDGKEQIIRLAKSGDALGYRALMADSSYSASAVALEDSAVCFISREDMNDLINHNPKVGADIMRLLSKALGEAEEKMAKMALKPVRERLAEALLLLKNTYGNVNGSQFHIAISREDLASLVGTAKETAIRFLSEFKDEGIVSTQGSTITILDAEKLIKISELYD